MKFLDNLLHMIKTAVVIKDMGTDSELIEPLYTENIEPEEYTQRDKVRFTRELKKSKRLQAYFNSQKSG